MCTKNNNFPVPRCGVPSAEWSRPRAGTAAVQRTTLQGYLAHKKQPIPWDPHRALGLVRL